ncbi:hypothetical protein HU200_048234 [Digitaria exilis]|uniref:Uncharacterized protein n=1 Tax=Digitaria exilis TaxID=1010633 RepID=A0A835ED84_9POAL|nr:hypothetical protein HU200_048234 [Digitaria exilis]
MSPPRQPTSESMYSLPEIARIVLPRSRSTVNHLAFFSAKDEGTVHMARPVHGVVVVVLPLILAVFLLLQVSESSRSSSPPVAHVAAPPPSSELLLDGATPSSSAATSWGAVASSSGDDRAAVVREGPKPTCTALLRSKLARRFLEDVDEAGTDGAGLSCHSNSVHIHCPPASSKP